MGKPIKTHNFINRELIQKAAEGGARLQQIQMIVWDYMQTPKLERNGVEMAIKIDNLYKKK